MNPWPDGFVSFDVSEGIDTTSQKTITYNRALNEEEIQSLYNDGFSLVMCSLCNSIIKDQEHFKDFHTPIDIV